MTYKMTDEYRKVLTEMIEEKVHYEICPIDKRYRYCVCGFVERNHSAFNGHIASHTRDFTTDPDMMKVFRWLVDNWKWGDIAIKTKDDFRTFGQHWYMEDCIAWLLYDAERFCCLVAQAKMEGVIK